MDLNHIYVMDVRHIVLLMPILWTLALCAYGGMRFERWRVARQH